MRAQIGGHVVNEFPCKCWLGHVDMIGQIVQPVKDNVVHAIWTDCRQNLSMARESTPTETELAFIARTKEARLRRFEAAKDMAASLKIGAARYAKYETRTPLPHEYVAQFCLIAGVSIEWLFTGQERRRA